MTQEEYSAACAQNNAEYTKESLRLQQALQARKDQLHDLTKDYQEEKAKIEKAIQKLKLDMAAATARAADTKARMNREYLESLKAETAD